MIRLRHGNAIVDVGGAIERTIRDTIERLAPTLAKRLEDEVEELRADAEGQWPVSRRDKLHSRAMFVHGLRIDGDTLSAYVRNNAEWAVYIKSYQNGLNGRSAVVELLRKPLKAAAGDVARDCAEEIRKLVR